MVGDTQLRLQKLGVGPDLAMDQLLLKKRFLVVRLALNLYT